MALTKEKLKTSIIFNIFLMLLLAVLIYVIFFFSLDRMTSHGSQYNVPVMLGKKTEQAVKELKDQGYRVDVDSSYDLKEPPGIVLSQMPDVGSFVKKGRTIFLTVNKKEAPLTPMPELTGLSYRSGLMVLKSNKLLIGDTTHVPDIADGAILEQSFNGKQIAAGESIPQGSKIDLVIGDGLGNVEFDVPDVIGMSYQEGIAVLNASGLQFIDVWDPPITDSGTAIIYYQSPEAQNGLGETNQIQEGGFIDIKISQNPVLEDRTRKKGNNSGDMGVENDDDGDW